MPGHDFCGDGFEINLPLSTERLMGRLFKTGTSQKTCHMYAYVQSFREKKRRIII
jgi:hypothetical protein